MRFDYLVKLSKLKAIPDGTGIVAVNGEKWRIKGVKKTVEDRLDVEFQIDTEPTFGLYAFSAEDGSAYFGRIDDPTTKSHKGDLPFIYVKQVLKHARFECPAGTVD